MEKKPDSPFEVEQLAKILLDQAFRNSSTANKI